jgi:hypothetical protein
MPSTRALLALAAAASLAACGDARTIQDEQGSGTGVGHPEGYAEPAVHGPDANASIATCQGCHAPDFSGGWTGRSCNECHASAGFADWQSNCTFCHGTKTPGWSAATQLALAAPPQGVNGQTAASDPGVGAHQAHVAANRFTGGFGCAECHPAVAALLDANHLGPSPAEVQLGARASAGGATPVYTPGAAPSCATTYCHGTFVGGVNGGQGATMVWNDRPGSATCSSCHTAPAANSKPNSVWHERHVFGTNGVPAPQACGRCHLGYGSDSVNAALHVNGEAEAIVQPSAGAPVRVVGWDCATCHGALGI